MSRLLAAAVAATLALPVLALAALIGLQEREFHGAIVVNVPIRGYDPRDLLRGHYIQGQFDWDWEGEPAAPDSHTGIDGAVCVLTADAPKPRLRFLAGWKTGDRREDGCRAIIAGRGWAKQGPIAARFAPTNLDAGGGQVKLFVPEDRAADLETLLLERPGALTVDLAVRPDGSAAIKALRVDGERLGR
ncbi:hypothetical protein BH10PSE6_BH10PSE6_36310 [soil metagenome]